MMATRMAILALNLLVPIDGPQIHARRFDERGHDSATSRRVLPWAKVTFVRCQIPTGVRDLPRETQVGSDLVYALLSCNQFPFPRF
jgi:hypothetical protein